MGLISFCSFCEVSLGFLAASSAVARDAAATVKRVENFMVCYLTGLAQ